MPRLPLSLAKNLLGYLLALSSLSKATSVFEPVGLALGSQHSVCGSVFESFRLNQSFPLATLDYGHEVAGYPFFEVESVHGHVQVEVKYSEEAIGLNHNFSDGPFPYAVALANTYRVETYEITEPGRIDAFLLQGGQRWQSIRLLTDGEVVFTAVGFVPSIPVVDMDDLPGTFTSDNEMLNDIWKLGARAAVASCVESGTQKTMWEIDEENGAFIRGMRAGTTPNGTFFENYTLEFDTKIQSGGIGWTVAFPVASPARGIQLNLVAEHQPFVNANTTIFRPNSIIFGYGYSFVNVTTLTSWHLDTFEVPFSVRNNTWYRIKTVLGNGHLAVSVDNASIFNVTLGDYNIGESRIPGGSIDTLGSWGFGGWQDQAGHFRNVVVYDSASGTELYRNSMTDASAEGVVREYGVRTNYESVCLDGPKRDRLAWLGDFLHTVRIVGTSTSRYDLARGTLQLFVDWQTASGLMPYAPAIGYDPTVSSYEFARGGGRYFEKNEVYGIILPDYQILGVLSFAEYVRRSNDLGFAMATWNHWADNVDWISEGVNSTTGLLSLFGAFLGPSEGGAAINCAFVEALRAMAQVAVALEKHSDAGRYDAMATSLAHAINERLWNEELGIYGLSPSQMDEFSVSSIAFCVTSETASPQQAERFISALSQLRLGPGYKDSSLSNSSDPETNLSPNTNGFLLLALMQQQTPEISSVALALLRSLWKPMLSDKRTATGASWEYVNQQGKPGLGLFTSLSHPWGGAPTYILTEWMAGIQAAKNREGFGYEHWVINPQIGMHIGLKEVRSKVVTAFGGYLEVHWRIVATDMEVVILAPNITSGIFKLNGFEKRLSGRNRYMFSVAI
ncbi:hypothetical protein S7711_00226 [Stachybotrys chartarum IBT 7711]|uniref:Alpha-L-rhamnosidase six-hairpin glycosidase domain-containing protein n=1 Tax=Stachybotrys chartarum (strain CBS 109288 / IBT 7711) TaxID=1280523 RepID=A0A084B3U8_STACB|nr:hypothetical protein S7711_00226 [Stachybotrys chartarum IBT 7711]